MDPAIEALKIINNKKTNINNKQVFHDESFIYAKTNEKLNEYYEYLKDKRNVLSVISSGDQIINMLLTLKEEIDCFDISIYPEYFLNLKLAAIRSLDVNEYIEFFFDDILTTKDEYYDDLYFDKIRYNLNIKSKDFWDKLFDYNDWHEIYTSTLFSSEVVSKSEAIKQNMYLKKEMYNKLKEKIDSITINYKSGNIFDISRQFKKRYDLIYLSNIAAYNDKEKYKELLKKLPLDKDGYILTYIFGSQENYRKVFPNEEYIDLNNDNSIMVYKKRKK